MKGFVAPLIAVAFAAGYSLSQQNQTQQSQQTQSTSHSSQGTASSSASASSKAQAGGSGSQSSADGSGANKWAIARPTHAVFYSPNPVGAGNRSIQVSPTLWEDQAKYYDLVGKQGKLLYAGPWRDGSGAMIILNCQSDQEAQNIADEDPVVKSLMYVGNVRAWNVTYVGPWVVIPDRSGQATQSSNQFSTNRNSTSQSSSSKSGGG